MKFYRTRRGKIAILVVFAIALAGEQVVFASLQGGGTSKNSTIRHPTTLMGRLRLALDDALGTSDRGVRRFQITSVRRSSKGKAGLVVSARWAINNDLSAGTVGNGAQADAWLIFDNVFNLREPIERVDLVGTYPASGKGETPVMRVWLDRSGARIIAGYGWDTLDAETAWPIIHKTYVSPDFQPLPLD